MEPIISMIRFSLSLIKTILIEICLFLMMDLLTPL